MLPWYCDKGTLELQGMYVQVKSQIMKCMTNKLRTYCYDTDSGFRIYCLTIYIQYSDLYMCIRTYYMYILSIFINNEEKLAVAAFVTTHVVGLGCTLYDTYLYEVEQ